MDIDVATLKTSFAQLKKTARCSEDVADWFRHHPQSLPMVPDFFVSHLELKLVMERFYPPTLSSETNLLYKILIMYTSTLPDEKTHKVSDTLFTEITGTRHSSSCSEPRMPEYKGQTYLTMPLQDWPYVTALAGYQILTGQFEFVDEILAVTTTVWPSVFPTIKWGLLQSMAELDLLPKTAADFVTWLHGFTGAQQAPDIIAPDTVLAM